MSSPIGMDWENMLVDENELGEGLNISSGRSGSLSFEDDISESENSSYTGDDLNSFEGDELLIEGNIENEIVLVGERAKSNNTKMKNVAVHLKERTSQLSSNIENKKSREVHVYDEETNNSDFEFEVSLCINLPSKFRDAVLKAPPSKQQCLLQSCVEGTST